jgi:tryptophanyl-tRNA synthetase
MAQPEVTSELPVRAADKEEVTTGVKKEQSIDPWAVDAGKDAEGNDLEFDYIAISKYKPSLFENIKLY